MYLNRRSTCRGEIDGNFDRFKGKATVPTEGQLFDEICQFYGRQGLADAARRIRNIVLVKVERGLPLISPAYDHSTTENQVSEQWERYYWEELRKQQ